MTELSMLERLSTEGRSVLVNSQQSFIHEIIDLCRNRYMIRFHVFHEKWWFVKLKHLSNGRELIAEWFPDRWVLREGKSELKVELYNVGE